VLSGIYGSKVYIYAIMQESCIRNFVTKLSPNTDSDQINGLRWVKHVTFSGVTRNADKEGAMMMVLINRKLGT
jgi:hypothetical protein